MTATSANPDLVAEFVEKVSLVRTFEAALVEGDGRTLDIRIAPYNVAATVSDPPDFRPYQEMFVPGAFERQASAPDRVRVWLNFEHDQGLRGIVGHGVELADRPDGLHGSFRVHENPDGDKALQLVHDGLLTGASLEYRPLRSRRVNGVMQRLRAHIDNVSLCRFPAYETAGVVAVREEPDPDETREFGEFYVANTTTPVVSDELTERLAALGVEALARIATTGGLWSGSPDRFDDEQYLRSCLLVRDGDEPAKERGSLPVLEPDGTLNTNALGFAAAALIGTRGGGKAAAARKLLRYYRAAGIDPPVTLSTLARS